MSTWISDPTEPHFTAEWWKKLGLQPAIPLPLNPTRSTSGLLVSGAGLLGGWTLHETAAGSGVIQFLDGTDNNGILISEAAVTASGSTIQSFLPTGPRFGSGLWLRFLSGTASVRGAVYVKIDAR